VTLLTFSFYTVASLGVVSVY